MSDYKDLALTDQEYFEKYMKSESLPSLQSFHHHVSNKQQIQGTALVDARMAVQRILAKYMNNKEITDEIHNLDGILGRLLRG